MLGDVVRGFRAAGVAVKILDGPIEPRARHIFQLDIRDSRLGEYVRVWPGASDVEFDALDADANFRQVVLRVREPRRRFEDIVRHPWRDSRENFERTTGLRVLRETPQQWVVERWTPSEERKYLCGFDETRLFIAQIPAGWSVTEAHAALMPREVREGRSAVRQGEWFFLRAERAEIEGLEAFAAVHPRCARRDEPVGPGDHPHVADEVVRVDRRERRGRREARFLDVFARGRVRHVDHRERLLSEWRRVVRNRAILPPPREPRLRWID